MALGDQPETRTQQPIKTIRELMILLAMHRLGRLQRKNADEELRNFLKWRYKVDIGANHICKVFKKGAAWFVKTDEEWMLSKDAELQLRFLMRAFVNLADGKARPPRPFLVRGDIFDFCAWSFDEFESVRADKNQQELENEDRRKLAEGDLSDPRYQMWLFDEQKAKEKPTTKPRKMKYRESRD